ncbi:MAG: hypothetical protein ACI85K_002732 [Hyphomicrobiaceae bacterium]|jgi:hypothetical protein
MRLRLELNVDVGALALATGDVSKIKVSPATAGLLVSAYA